MEPTSNSLWQFAQISKQIGRRLLIIAENRIELFVVEVQEGRERLLHSFALILGMAAFGLLSGMVLTATIVILLWSYAPVAVLLTLTVLYGSTAFCLYRRLKRVLRDWQSLAASREQLKRDRTCLENKLA